MKYLAIAILVGAANAYATTQKHFTISKYIDYLAKFNKIAVNNFKEFEERMGNFLSNDSLIEMHNEDSSASFKLGHNQFSDWHPIEYKNMLNYATGRNTN